ncbi:gluconate 2-dehydrogenase subunit 3 family protein, partial [Campylobacter jejuni]|nr:gluconate 2-dehydrogenase subunit 3 family protein [Campylobacter jejuni]
GWRMMQYPGAQMSYVDKIASDEFFNIEPMSLADMES